MLASAMGQYVNAERGTTMTTYLVLGRYTAQGRAGIVAEGGTSREAETRALFEQQLGGRLLSYAFLMGPYDFFLVVEVPDDASILAPVLLGSSGGSFTVDLCKVISPTEFDAIAATTRSLAFRLAGE